MKTTSLNVSLPPRHTAIIRRFRKSGRYQSKSAVVRAALERLDEADWNPNAYPPGSLLYLYTQARNREESQLNKVSSLVVDHDD